MLDKVWWIWQALHPELAETIYGTVTMNNSPASANATVNDILDTKGLSDNVALKDVFNTIGGSPLCYVYI